MKSSVWYFLPPDGYKLVQKPWVIRVKKNHLLCNVYSSRYSSMKWGSAVLVGVEFALCALSVLRQADYGHFTTVLV